MRKPTLSIETVIYLLLTRERCEDPTCRGYVVMERSDNDLLEIERCDMCVFKFDHGTMRLYDEDVRQLVEAREDFRAMRKRLNRDRQWFAPLQGNETRIKSFRVFQASRSRARASLLSRPAQVAA